MNANQTEQTDQQNHNGIDAADDSEARGDGHNDDIDAHDMGTLLVGTKRCNGTATKKVSLHDEPNNNNKFNLLIFVGTIKCCFIAFIQIIILILTTTTKTKSSAQQIIYFFHSNQLLLNTASSSSGGDGSHNKLFEQMSNECVDLLSRSPLVMDLPTIEWHHLDQGTDNVSMFTSRFQTDLDSIEKFDVVDHVSVNPAKQTAQYGQNGVRTVALPKRRIDSNDDDEEEDKGVRCLYYALQCCECSIS